jgi:hypothetical protein
MEGSEQATNALMTPALRASSSSFYQPTRNGVAPLAARSV